MTGETIPFAPDERFTARSIAFRVFRTLPAESADVGGHLPDFPLRHVVGRHLRIGNAVADDSVQREIVLRARQGRRCEVCSLAPVAHWAVAARTATVIPLLAHLDVR